MKVFNNRNCGKHVESHNTYKQCLILVQVGAEVDVFSNELLPQEDHVPLFTKRKKFAELPYSVKFWRGNTLAN